MSCTSQELKLKKTMSLYKSRAYIQKELCHVQVKSLNSKRTMSCKTEELKFKKNYVM